MVKMDAKAILFSSPSSDEVLAKVTGYYIKKGSWNMKSYYEQGAKDGDAKHAMWFAKDGIMSSSDGSEVVPAHSWVIAGASDASQLFGCAWHPETDEALCRPNYGRGCVGGSM